jgi:hypothetical protein
VRYLPFRFVRRSGIDRVETPNPTPKNARSSLSGKGDAPLGMALGKQNAGRNRILLLAIAATAMSLTSCNGGGGSTGVVSPCLPGAQLALVKPAPGSTVPIPSTGVVIEIAASSSLLSDNYGIAVSGNSMVVSGSPLIGPILAPTASPSPSPSPGAPSPSPSPPSSAPSGSPSPTTSPTPPLPFSSPIFYTSTVMKLSTGQTYQVELSGSGCADVPITGAIFSG